MQTGDPRSIERSENTLVVERIQELINCIVRIWSGGSGVKESSFLFFVRIGILL